MSWIGNNQNLDKGLPKTVTIELDQGVKFMISVRLNTESWRWEPSVRDLSGSVSIPEDTDLSARTPGRAAARALEWLLEMADRGELAH
jgi:hypothetical protein